MANDTIQVSIHSTGANGFGLTSDGNLVSDGKFVSPAVSEQIVLFDDFLGDVIADQWNVVEGADTTTSDAAINNQIGGVLRLITGDSATLTYAGNGIQITQGAFYNFRAAEGGMAIEARVKLDAITTAGFFVGFTDVGTFEAPIEGSGSGNGITTNATDAAGFLFDTRMTNANLWCVGVANDVDATPVNTGIAPVAATYVTLRMEVDTSGTATYFVNKAVVGRVANAVRPTIALTPTIAATSFVAAVRNLDVDYIHAKANRY
jgi:hypothetical protein